ncbi:MAG: glycosyltransferase family 2 protein [Nevskia sp.]|nr:glycosyltransferase family 2 protein [Nevskia sp.]
MKPAIVIPFFNHERAIARTVASLRGYGLPCWLVDDGSDARCAPVLDGIAAAESRWLTLLRLPRNGGKGRAVVAGLEAARRAGCSHAVQIDADGQHDAGDLGRLLEVAAANPGAVVTGIPVYDRSVPRSRLYGRYATHLWVWINTLSGEIRDSMCGFRVYPLEAALHAWDGRRGASRMEFDSEILVRLSWAGVPVISVPTRVTYPHDGVSHFRLWRDNLRISAMHARLFFGMLARLPRLLARRRGAAAMPGRQP